MITDIREYQIQALVTANYRSEEYPFNLMVEEVGEVIGKLNKFARKNQTSTDKAIKFARHEFTSQLREDLKKELGDVAWSWVVCCHELDIDPAAVLEDNILKLRDRMNRNVIDGSGDNR